MSNEQMMDHEQETGEVVSIGTRFSPVPAPAVGWIASVAPQDIPCVDYEGNKAGPLPAECAMVPMPGTFASMAERRQRVVLVFDGNDPLRPIITAFLRSREMKEGAAQERLRIEAHDEISLVCGNESVTLRRNKGVLVSGTNITVDSLGVVQVRGADTEIG